MTPPGLRDDHAIRRRMVGVDVLVGQVTGSRELDHDREQGVGSVASLRA
jgi:hypothetical protein